MRCDGYCWMSVRVTIQRNNHAPEHSVCPASMVKPPLQLLHMAAPCLVQAAPIFGEPFGQLHMLAEKRHTHARVRLSCEGYCWVTARVSISASNYAPEHLVWSVLIVNPALQLSHTRLLGEPFGQLLSDTHTHTCTHIRTHAYIHTHTYTWVRMSVRG